MKRIVILSLSFVLAIAISCNNESKSKSNKETTELDLKKVDLGDSCVLKDHSYESVIKYHDKGCLDERWPMRIEADLNKDSINEVMLKIEDYSRGAFYVLYTKKDNSWQIISEEVAANHLEIQLNEEVNSGWFNFSTFESHKEFIWSWRDGKYENIEIIENEQ
ncbi:MAG: hypothetical protein CVU05_06495 [Bacteroidetes bacterium HGW-Bacteroidetes-21]|jgi:hypothetical protein|nr:MAG: hypothetical protein CVU05_06495 [Bacteroidetes bacterium HGW-Bacteroidetes-21]